MIFPPSVSSGVENSAMVAGDHGRGEECGHGHGRDVGGGRECENMDPHHCIHCGKYNYTSYKC